jgi:ribonuclease HI
MRTFTIHTDGAARGNPGPAAYAFVLSHDGEPVLEEAACLGQATNNVAEYTAVVKALEKAKELGGQRVVIKSDSELMVKQMTGAYKVRNEGLLPLYEQARRLVRGFDDVQFQHVRREENKDADRLCNEALDAVRGGHAVRPVRQARGPSANLAKSPAEPNAEKWKRARSQALEVLQAAAASWREHPALPPPIQVWNQILGILEEQKLLQHD